MRWFAVTAACVGALVVTAPAGAQPKKPKAPQGPKVKPENRAEPPRTPEKIRADSLFDDGRKYLAAKEYALACTAFEQSHEADPAIGTQLNIALCYEEWGKIVAAYRAYVQAEKLATEKSDDRASGARVKVDLLAPKVPHLQVEIPADADIATVFTLDGKAITREQLADDLLLEPGRHLIEARVPGKPPKLTSVELKQAERRSITVDVPRPELTVIVTTTPRRKARFYGGISMTVFGAISVGGAGFLALLARQDYTEASVDCPAGLCESRAAFEATQDARKRANYMTFIGAGGAVIAGVGVYLILTSRGEKKVERTQALQLVPTLTSGGVGLAIGGSL